MNDLLRELMDDSMVANVAATKAAGMTRVTASLPVEYLARIQQHLDTGGWIKVSERLPEDRTPVFAIVRGERRVAELRWERPGFEDTFQAFQYWDDPYDDGQDWEWDEVTHWQPLPALPRSE